MIEEPLVNTPLNRKSDSNEQNRFVQEVLKDFEICCISREASLMARKDVLRGRGKFAITGDGKEVPQVAMARAFRKGDHRSGYYRDQTFMLALGLSTVQDFFAQIYADAENDPFSGGRQMNNHFATSYIDTKGNWTNHNESFNITSGISCTGGQMARALGVALASKKYRLNPKLNSTTSFSKNGDEVCFCTIGDASTSEGAFWETVNAAGVMQVPLAISIWDDGYGISVPVEYQTTKGDISAVLEGFRKEDSTNGIELFTVEGWNYPALCEMYEKGIAQTRSTHTPVIFHVKELTQPQGHSTSGSHERYKSPERLQWEKDHDCLLVMEKWMIDAGIATKEKTEQIKADAKEYVKKERDAAWERYMAPVLKQQTALQSIFVQIETDTKHPKVKDLIANFSKERHLLFFELVSYARRILQYLSTENISAKQTLQNWIDQAYQISKKRYHSNLYSDSDRAAINIPIRQPIYSDQSKKQTGYNILNTFFDKMLEEDPRVYAFGEDVGKIGDVNQGFAGMQDKYGTDRVFDTGIREWTIVGQAIGLGMRGLRPIAEIQYLDYLIYGLAPLSDDLATLRYRSNGQQHVPAIIRTRGHRLEGIWHSGSPMGMMLHALRGIYILTPRNMVQAAGLYKTMLESDDPAIIVEPLNGYRLHERMPDNIGEYTIPIGVPEILNEGTDITLVTYGSCIRIAQKGVEQLQEMGILVELIDVQTLMPFDLEHAISSSLKKTNRIVFMDEDVPGGATAYMMQEVLEKQNGYQFLDAPVKTLTAKAHRPPYGSDGDYFSKPNAEDVVDVCYQLMHESDPSKFPF